MMTRWITTRPPGARQARRGFTLIELLVVILILAILVALVVGVATVVRRWSQEKETRADLMILNNAIQKYYEITETEYPSDWYPPGTRPAGGPTDLTEAGRVLCSYLLSDDPNYLPPTPKISALLPAEKQQLRARIAKATQEAIRNLPAKSFSAGATAFSDAYGNTIGYIMDGGIGGGPVMISAGPDGYFGGPGGTPTDNIRSDKQ